METTGENIKQISKQNSSFHVLCQSYRFNPRNEPIIIQYRPRTQPAQSARKYVQSSGQTDSQVAASRETWLAKRPRKFPCK